MSDTEFLIKQWHDILHEFKLDYDKWEKHTLGDYLSRCAEIINNQIEYKVIDIKVEGISSYLYSQLSKEGIEVSDRYIQKILPDNYKRNYSKSEYSSELTDDNWQTIETGDPEITFEKNQFNEIKINGVEQRPKQIKKEVYTEPKEIKVSKDTRELTYLKACSKLSNKFHLTFETLISRYNESDEIQSIIDDEVGDVEAKLQDYAKAWASIENSKGMIDLRRSFGEFEKVVACFLIETGETIAHISQLMDYSEKYGSIGILREPQVREFFETVESYPLYLRSCPKCLTDIANNMNENISLYRECKDLNITLPVIKHNI